jgi:Lon protease-like protein
MRIPLFPLNSVLFPGSVQELVIFEERYKALLAYCIEQRSPFGIALIKQGREVGGPAQPYSVGTVARIAQVERMPGDRSRVVCAIGERFRITSLDKRAAEYLVAEVDLFPDEPSPPPALAMVADRVATLFDEYYRYMISLAGGWQRASGDGSRTLMFDTTALERRSLDLGDPSKPDAPQLLFRTLAEDPTKLANTVASQLAVHVSIKQDLLESPSALQRLQREAEVLADELEEAEERLRTQNRRRANAFGLSN